MRRHCRFLGDHPKAIKKWPVYGCQIVLERSRTFYPNCYLSLCSAVVLKAKAGVVALAVAAEI